jgi:hypothetical protein
MQQGFVADGNQSGFAQEVWVPGEPERSFWTGLKLKKDQLIPVATHRCPRCGYLESYAMQQTIPERYP